MSSNSLNKNPWTTPTWAAIAVSSVVWWVIAGQRSFQRSVLLVWLSLASFMVGCLIGFLFTSYGEENDTLGKLKDWLIGGITALTVAKFAALKGVLLTFAAGPGPIEFGFTVGASIFYAGLGFFFMFFQRELILNVLLAQSRAERGRVEGSQASQVIQKFLLRLPPSVLSGVDFVEEISDVDPKEAEDLKKLLYGDDVTVFLKQADEAAKSGQLDWDIVSKTAYIYYYRTYFQKKEDQASEVDRAVEWITRALNMNPLHIDLTMKYADMLGMREDYVAEAAVLERLINQPEGPAVAKEWLGYCLRFVPERLKDAVRYSEEYHAQFPDESDTFFNIAYAYANKYCVLANRGTDTDSALKYRDLALSKLKEGLHFQPEMAEHIATEWTAKGKAFSCLLADREFRSIVGLPEDQTNSVKSVKTESDLESK